VHDADDFIDAGLFSKSDVSVSHKGYDASFAPDDPVDDIIAFKVFGQNYSAFADFLVFPWT
jgi:hypothetical protein